jgi:phosphotriesterase-related protein
MRAMQIMTVLGPIAPEEMGITLPHEHLLIDLYRVIPDYRGTLDDEDLAIEELMYFKRAGGTTLVDPTNIGLGRDPKALQRIARATGVHIIMGSGWYREIVYPPYVHEKTVNELADMIVRDLVEGVDGTGVRAGVIGEIGTERDHITPAQEKVFRAAARAHKRTGATITTHTTHLGELATEQLALLREEGVNLSRVIVGHMGDRRHLRLELPIVQAGAYVEFDHIGFTEFQRDAQRAANVAKLVSEGYLGQILLSLDICFTSNLHWYGGKGYDYVLSSFVPLLKKAGLTEDQIHTLLVENPRRALAGEVSN